MVVLIRSVNVPLRGCGVCDVSGDCLPVCCAMDLGLVSEGSLQLTGFSPILTSFDPHNLFVSGSHYSHCIDHGTETLRDMSCPRFHIKLEIC